jgi:hypothetical protein
MTTKTTLQTPPQSQTAVPVEVVPAVPWKEIVPLSRVLSSITRDSRNWPQNYLDETEVPHGGE